MPDTPMVPPFRGLDDIYLARPLALAAVLVIAGHLLRGGPTSPADSRTHLEEVTRHG